MIQTDFHYAPLAIGHFPTFEEKINTVIAFLEMNRIYCRLQDSQIPNKSPDSIYVVVEVCVPGGRTSFIKSLLQECLLLLKESADEYVANYDDYYSIRKCLENMRDTCIQLTKKYDIFKSLPYSEHEIERVVKLDDKWCSIYKGQLNYSENIRIELTDHYSLRKEFFEEMVEFLDHKLNEHLEIAPFPKKPYKWDSENPHLEISELLYALIKTRLTIKEGEKGSMAKLVKEFFNLFGLDDGPYHERLQRIRNRKNKESWLNELPEYINSLRKENQTTKE